MRRAPFRDARARLADELARRPPVRPEDLDLPPAHGFEAHRALIADVVEPPPGPAPRTPAGRLRRWAASRRPHRRPAAPPRADREVLQEAAVRAQARLGAETRAEAEAAVACLVAQLAKAAQLPWAADARRWEAAVEETVRYTVFDSDVSSRRAQEAWRRFWANRARNADPRLAVTLARALAAQEREWREAWDYWSATFELRDHA